MARVVCTGQLVSRNWLGFEYILSFSLQILIIPIDNIMKSGLVFCVFDEMVTSNSLKTL